MGDECQAIADEVETRVAVDEFAPLEAIHPGGVRGDEDVCGSAMFDLPGLKRADKGSGHVDDAAATSSLVVFINLFMGLLVTCAI